jgi:hypothetical protein
MLQIFRWESRLSRQAILDDSAITMSRLVVSPPQPSIRMPVANPFPSQEIIRGDPATAWRLFCPCGCPGSTPLLSHAFLGGLDPLLFGGELGSPSVSG